MFQIVYANGRSFLEAHRAEVTGDFQSFSMSVLDSGFEFFGSDVAEVAKRLAKDFQTNIPLDFSHKPNENVESVGLPREPFLGWEVGPLLAEDGQQALDLVTTQGIDEILSLLDEVADKRDVRLLAIPRTRAAQPAHHFDQVVPGVVRRARRQDLRHGAERRG